MARLRRHLPSELVAERAYIFRQTLTAIEKGSPSVAIGAYAAVLHALKIDEQISAAETSRQMVVYC